MFLFTNTDAEAGTTTDIHDSMQAKLEAKNARQRLLSVLAHAQVTILTFDTTPRITMLEGADIRDVPFRTETENGSWYDGKDVPSVISLTNLDRGPEFAAFTRCVTSVISGKVESTYLEHGTSKSD